MTKHILILCFLVISCQLIGQKTQSLKVAHSLTDKTSAIDIKVEAEGTYDVLILSPNGEIQSRPIHKQQYKAGQLINLSVNSKYWRSGQYQIIVQNDEGQIVNSRSLIVDLSNKEKERIRGPQ